MLAYFRPATHEFTPADESFRRMGRVSRDQDLRNIYGRSPTCCVGVVDFEFLNPYGHIDEPGWQKILREDRAASCGENAFIRWVPGLSIRDHKEMLDRKFMIEREDRRDREMREREDRRDALVTAREDVRDERENARDKREDDRDRGVEKRHRTELWVLGWVIAGATVASAIISAGATISATKWLGHDHTVVVVVTPPPSPTVTLGP